MIYHGSFHRPRSNLNKPSDRYASFSISSSSTVYHPPPTFVRPELSEIVKVLEMIQVGWLRDDVGSGREWSPESLSVFMANVASLILSDESRLYPSTLNIRHGGGYVETLTTEKAGRWKAETMARYLGMCKAIQSCTLKVGWNPTSISEGGEGFVAGEV